jgi:hypothetical protein
MTEQTASETPVVESTETPVEEPKKRFRFTRKQIAITTAAAAATVGLIVLKVKSSASKALDEETDAPDAENSETDASV